MLKIPKGLKKKKKGKKGKHKGDEDLFTPEELEAYKREKALKEQQQHEAEQHGDGDGYGSPEHCGEGHQQHPDHQHQHPHHEASDHASTSASASASAPEEEDRFQALLGGVDSILNKTQKDLDRIKSTSFFQRKPTPSELEERARERERKAAPARPAAPSPAAAATARARGKKKKRWVGFEDGHDQFETDEEDAGAAAEAPHQASTPQEVAAEHVQFESEESEEDDEEEGDDIFDTSYIDVITSGEVKLAYIPDSPVEEQAGGDDPFDTTYAAKVIGNDEDIKKRQKLEKVSLGIAVDVLTGKAAPPSKPPPLPENAVAKRAVPRRVKPVDLLKLGSFDEGQSAPPATDAAEGEEKQEEPKSILDDDALLAIPEDLPPVGTPIIPPASIVPVAAATETAPKPSETEEEEPKKEEQVDLSEFDVIAEKPVTPIPISNLVLVAAALGGPPAPIPDPEEDDLEDEFAALAAESIQKKKEEEDEFAIDGDDPFDTTAVASILGEPETAAPSKPAADVDVLLAGAPAHWSAFDEDAEHHKVTLKPARPPPPRPASPATAALAASARSQPEGEADPFDTSFAQNILPGKTELKFIEREVLGKPSIEINEARILSNSDSDFDFNPREGEEPKNVPPGVSIHVTDPAGLKESPEGDPFDTSDTGLTALRPIHRDLLGGSTTDLSKLAHDPIEPAPEQAGDAGSSALPEAKDPFDTSAVESVAAPGKTELKYLEKEILGDVKAAPVPLNRGISDEDFDPRAEEERAAAHAEGRLPRPDVLVVQPQPSEAQSHKTVAFALPSPSVRPDLLAAGNEEGSKFSKPLTPYYAENPPPIDPLLNGELDADPFDTTHVSNLAPGKTELKILESELVGDAAPEIKNSLSDDNFNPRGAPPVLAPGNPDLFAVEDGVGHKPLTPEIEEAADVDPFDTSIASNIAPGKAELKVLEKELISGDPQTALKRTYTDPDFNPRDNVGQATDLLNQSEEGAAGAKPLTPVLGEQNSFENGVGDDVDPFDTSIASDIRPGKTELRILESELIGRQ